MTIVKLPREVAEAIEHLRTITQTNHEVMAVVERAHINPVATIVRKWAFNSTGAGSPDLLMQALVSGYEIEKTPEELREIAYGKIRDYYAECERKERRARIWDNYETMFEYMHKRHATTRVLNILGIKIEEVNA